MRGWASESAVVPVDDVLTLVSAASEQDENGIWHNTETETQVFCTVKSASRAEVFEGGRIGLNPEYQFNVFSGDYDGQEILKFHGQAYTIYRKYTTGDVTELYCEKRKGTDNGGS